MSLVHRIRHWLDIKHGNERVAFDEPNSQCVLGLHVEDDTEDISPAVDVRHGMLKPKEIKGGEVEQNQIQDRRRRIDDVLE